MPTQKRQLGDTGEKIVVDYLKKQGYHILGQNYQKPWGEIDIIVQNNKEIIFIEVKTRTVFQGQSLSPEENVRFDKKQKLIRTAQTYLLEKKYPPETSWQIDVIAVELNLQTRKANLKHIKNAIWQ
ncbi:MAG: YraN family protein [Candidatus Portnoybacteria bacterium]|nr:YraN family protein [Candidatus Portnoybacteria bacterium]